MKKRRVGRRAVRPTAAGKVQVAVKLSKTAMKAFRARGRPIANNKRVTLRKR